METIADLPVYAEKMFAQKQPCLEKSTEILSKIGDDIPEPIVKFVCKCAAQHHLKDCELTKTASGIKGDGYLGVVTFLELTGTDEKTNKRKELSIVCKTAHTAKEFREKIPVNLVFKREIYMYTRVFPHVASFQINYKLKNNFFAFTECLHSSEEEGIEALLLKNIKKEGYSLYDRQKAMDVNHLEIVLKEYAKMHAVSFAMKHEKPELWNSLSKDVEQCVFDDKISDFISMYESNLNYLEKLFGPEDQKSIDGLKALKKNLLPVLELSHNYFDEYSVILHGDCWCNNMMFKYEDKSDPKKPTDVCLLDFQLSKVGPTPLDTSYFFFACGSKDTVKEYKHYIEDVYYATLAKQLEEYGLDPKTVYPIEKMREEWRKFAFYGFMFSSMVCKLALSDVDEVPDMTEMIDDQTLLENRSFKNQHIYDEKMREVVRFLAEDNMFVF